VETGKHNGYEKQYASFIRWFLDKLARQVELGQKATDYDFIRFQKSINANVKGAARTRQEILLRKALMHSTLMADIFDSNVLATSGVSNRVKELSESVSLHIGRLNSVYSAVHGVDLFKATNKTNQAMLKIGKPAEDVVAYATFIDNLYFLFRESCGQRLSANLPQSFIEVNTLRTELQHDVDHGEEKKIRAKKIKAGAVFEKYAGVKSPDLLESSRFVLVQANLLSAIELDLTNLTLP
jgi:hypothetical protein